MIAPKNHHSNIMLVDDTPANVKLLEEMLKDRGYGVRPFHAGRPALAAAADEPPDLILLDINMPEMNGHEVCQRLKADPKLKDIPVIFISALNDTEDKVKAFSLGGADYVTKPFKFAEVHARVQTHLELRRQKRELQENWNRLQKLETLRENLVNMIIHDLRSPLSAIVGYLDVLRMKVDAKLGAAELRYLDIVRQNTDKLIGMITSLLDVSRLEAGEMPLHRHAYDLAVLVREVMASLGSLIGERHVSVESGPEPVVATVDKEIIQRVIANLVDNAVKFTPNDGQIRIAVNRKDSMAQVAVTDTGPGIPAEYHTRIFEKFGQVGQQTRKHSTGLGLTFCKLAVEAHGGRIGVDSEVGKGSTFWFLLPLR